MSKHSNIGKKVLKGYRIAKDRIKVIDRIIKKGITNVDIDGIDYDRITTGKTYKITSIVENLIIVNEKKIKKLEDERETLKEILEITDIAIEGLRVNQKRIIKLYYLGDEKINLWQVANIIGYSQEHLKKDLLPKALEEVGKRLVGYEEIIDEWE